MIDYKILLLLLTAGSNLSLSIFIFLKSPKNKINIPFSLMLLLIATWSCTTGLFFLAPSLSAAIFLSAFIYLSAAYISLSFYFFAYNFPYPIKSMNPLSKTIHLLAFILVAIVVIYFKVEFIFSDQTGQTYLSKINPWPYFAFATYFLSYIISSFLILYKKYIAATSTHRKLLRVVIFATLLSAFFGSIFNLILPIFTYEYIWIGPLFTLVMVFILIKYVFLIED